MRARGDLVEIRAADLRFTGDEVATYLNGLNGLGLATTDLAALETRTEGWVAALQLAALSLQDLDDPSAFIAGFAGDDRFVVDYLADEVLSRQPTDVRRFLLDTSILDRLTGPLCDAVSPLPDARTGKAMLDALDRANLFLVPLDGHRRWYRYHHLFADVLQAHLLDERPDDVPRAASPRRPPGTPTPGRRRPRSGTPWPPATPSAPPTSSSSPSRPCVATGARTSSAAGSTSSPTRSSRPPGARDRADRRADGQQRLRRRRRAPPPRRGRCSPGPRRPGGVDEDELPRLPSAVEMYWAALALIGGDPAARSPAPGGPARPRPRVTT